MLIAFPPQWLHERSSMLRYTHTACPAYAQNIMTLYGSDSSVGIATELQDGPGSNPDGDEIFRGSRPALGPTQPPVKWVPVLSRG